MKGTFWGLKKNVVLSIFSVILLMQAFFLSFEGIVLVRMRKTQRERFVNRLFENEGRAVPVIPEPEKEKILFEAPFAKKRDGASESGESPNKNHFESKSVLSINGNITHYVFSRGDTNDDFHLYFATRTAPDGAILELITDIPYSENDSDMTYFLKLINEVNESNRNSGLCDNFFYERRKKNYGYLTVYVDYHREIREQRFFLAIASLILAVSLLFSTIAVFAINIFVLTPIKKAFDAQKRFISDAGHELKTPIAAINANLEVLKDEIPDNKWISYIAEENDRMKNLVMDLMYLAHTDAGREKFVMESVNISDAITFAALPLESLIFEKGKKLVLNIESDIEMTCDERKIKQLVVILLDNAVKNSDSGDVITVTAKKHDNSIVIKVHNTGWGIKQEDLEKIFQRFYRVDTSRNRETGGYGLGLSIASAIVREHHGKITATSEFGKWAEFSVILPFSKKTRK